MKVGIMQPYFFPYIGYFQLINSVDIFILFDTPQFIRHGWIERNSLIQLNGNKFYIKVALVKEKRETSIKDRIINHNVNWKDKILAQLTHYRKAPHYQVVLKLINRILVYHTSSISELNFYALKQTCEYLNIDTPIKVFSKMNTEILNVEEPDGWALKICKEINASHYINPIGGINIFDIEKYEKENIKINFLKSKDIKYKQFKNEFIPWLSIIDVMMFNTPDEISEMLNEYELK